MDRSSMHRVETTNDKEKRQVFKAKLAQKIEGSQEATLASEPYMPESHLFPVGTAVWHPELGVGKVFSIDKKSNQLILETDLGQIELGLSKALSTLRLFESGNPEPAYKYQPKIETPAEPVKVSEVKVLSVTLPNIFKSWKTVDQFEFLTRNQHLTIAEANDVFSVLSEKAVNPNIQIAWVDPDPINTFEPEKLSFDKGLSADFVSARELIGKRVWHPDFGECQVIILNDAENDIVLSIGGNHLSFVLDVTLPKLVPLADGQHVDHAPKRLGSKEVVSETVPVEPRTLSVSLPKDFNEWNEYNKFVYLNGRKHLTPEESKDVIAAANGKQLVTLASIDITWEDVSDVEGRVGFKKLLENRVENSHIEFVPTLIAAPVPSGVNIEREEFDTVEKTLRLSKISIVLPEAFKNWNAKGQHIFLTKSRLLTPEEADGVIATINNQVTPGVEYSISWELSLANEKKMALKQYLASQMGSELPSGLAVQREYEEVETVKHVSRVNKLSVTLPEAFKTWTASDQYIFLSRTKKLTAEDANDVISVYNGKKPFNTKVQFEIVWS